MATKLSAGDTFGALATGENSGIRNSVQFGRLLFPGALLKGCQLAMTTIIVMEAGARGQAFKSRPAG